MAYSAENKVDVIGPEEWQELRWRSHIYTVYWYEHRLLISSVFSRGIGFMHQDLVKFELL